MDVIRGVRATRSEMNVPPSRKARMILASAHTDVFAAGRAFLMRLAFADEVELLAEVPEQTEGMVSVVTAGARVFIPLAQLVDMDKERARLDKALKKNEDELNKLEKKLNNPGFVGKAPEAVIAAERERAEKLRALVQQLRDSRAQLG